MSNIDDDSTPAPELPQSVLDWVPRLTHASIETAGLQQYSDCVIDKVYPGRPLVISFNYFYQQNRFDFFDPIRKLEQRVGGPFNRIFIRDSRHAFYQRGVKGLGDSITEIATKLREFIKIMQPSEIMTIGQSMGGCAAILYGFLVHADRVIAFGPMANLKVESAEQDGDTRWLPLLRALERNPPENRCNDFIAFAQAQPVHPTMHIIMGTNPVDKNGLPNLDRLHADRFAVLPSANLHIYPEAPHEICEWLADHQQMDELMYQMVTSPLQRKNSFLHLTQDKEGMPIYASVITPARASRRMVRVPFPAG